MVSGAGDEAQKWIAALRQFFDDPAARITCPFQADGELLFEWLTPPGQVGELVVRCPSCGAVTYVRSERPPSSG